MICCFLYLFLSILYLLLYLLFLFSLYTHSFFFSIISFLYIFFIIHIPDIFYRNFIDVNSLITVICVILYKHLWYEWCQVLNYICDWMLKCIYSVLKCICDCVLKCIHSCMLKFPPWHIQSIITIKNIKRRNDYEIYNKGRMLTFDWIRCSR